MDNNGYPTEEELAQLRGANFSTWMDVVDFIEFIESCWKYPEGFVLSHKGRGLELELHTYGWSGCEDVIGTLMENAVFWSLFWMQSSRGGHYCFRFDRNIFKA